MPEFERSHMDPIEDATATTTQDPSTELAALLIATAAGDRRAFKALYDLTSRRLFGVAMIILKHREAAEDVIQEAYVRVWTEARRYDPARGGVMPWLSRIVRNLAIDHLRRERHFMDGIGEFAEEQAAPTQPLGDRADLTKGLHRLAEDHRESLILTFGQGYTHEELAEHLGRPLGTAKARVRRGLQQLRAYLEPEPDQAPRRPA